MPAHPIKSTRVHAAINVDRKILRHVNMEKRALFVWFSIAGLLLSTVRDAIVKSQRPFEFQVHAYVDLI